MTRVQATIERLALDVRHRLRGLARDWAFTSSAILILSVGIAANTTIFSMVNAVLWRERPLVDSEGLVDIYQHNSNADGLDGASYPAYEDIAAFTDIFASTTAATVPMGVRYRDGNAGVRPAIAEYTTATYLSVLGLRPSLGRWIEGDDERPGAELVAVVGHQSWLRKFSADPSVIGRTVRLEGVPVTIVGVGPVGHAATLNLGVATDFWLPVTAIASLGGPPRALERRPEEAAFLVKARLGNGVSVAQAQATMDTLGDRLAAEYPDDDPGAGIRVIAASDVRIHPQMDGLLAGLGAALLTVVALVLMIACSNLATLLLVRGVARRKDISVRLAMGATRWQLVLDMVAESLLLTTMGAAAGGLVAWWAIRFIGALDLPVIVDFSLDARALAFTVALSLVTGVACGLASALHVTRVDLASTLRDVAPSRLPGFRVTLKHALVVFQVALSVLLLSCAGVFLQMRAAARSSPVGYAVDGIALLQTDARYAGYAASTAPAVCETLRQRVAALPGVESVALSRELPMQTAGARVVVDGPGSAAEPLGTAGAIWAGAGYFEALRIPLVHGRVFDARDRADTPRVAVINERLARRYFGTVDAIGRRFRADRDADGWYEVIGVVRDTGTADRNGDLVDPTPYLFYRSFTQAGLLPTTLIARTSLDAGRLVGEMQREMRSVDATLPVLAATTMSRYLDESLQVPAAIAMFLGALAALGLGLAGLGVYAVVALSVSQRSREIGIRMALGAGAAQVISGVGRSAAVLVGSGTGLGLVLSLLVTLGLRAAATPAPGVSLYRPAVDVAAVLLIAILMVVLGIAAACVPAARASTLDPITALRRD